jgi:hypothetical protein
MTSPRVGHLVLLVPLAAVAVWLVVRGRTAREDPAEVLHALRSASGPALPGAAAAGAIARSETSSYDRETLYEYIDGAAESYLGRGFERCLVATYDFAGKGGFTIEVSAEGYRFSAPGGARAQMLAERPAAAEPVPGVPDAFADATMLVAVRGRDYLKLTALADGPAALPSAAKALASIARAWIGETR